MAEDMKKRGFAALSPERLREIASSGGVARKKMYESLRRETVSRPNNPPRPSAPQA